MSQVRLTYTVGILNYNTRELLLENIRRSVESGIPVRNLVVVDNKSTDGSAAAVNEQYPDVRLVISPANLGYAGGMNKIVEFSDTDLVVLVTADCFVSMGTVEQLVSGVAGNTDVAVVGVEIVTTGATSAISATSFTFYTDGSLIRDKSTFKQNMGIG